eukprot:109095-Prymnesium_polylepis.1
MYRIPGRVVKDGFCALSARSLQRFQNDQDRTANKYETGRLLRLVRDGTAPPSHILYHGLRPAAPAQPPRIPTSMTMVWWPVRWGRMVKKHSPTKLSLTVRHAPSPSLAREGTEMRCHPAPKA